MKILSVTDRAHALLSKGYNIVADRLEPEMRQSVGGALYTYGRRRKQLANADANLRQLGSAVKEAFPEYLGA